MANEQPTTRVCRDCGEDKSISEFGGGHNVSLGNFGDSPELLRKAADYLELHQRRQQKAS